MSVLENLQPQAVMQYFEAICAIPHGSGNTGAIADYLVSFAEARGLEVHRDGSNNVIIIKEATPGYEDAPAIILQGHTDMVCAKTADCPIDMAKEPISIATDGEWIWAEGTSLGGDNGIAVAMSLALLDDAALAHPRMEVVLTVDEEIGLLGAAALDVSPLRGRTMLNLDSEEEGILTVSCAGGVTATVHVPVERELASGIRCTLTLEGLQGGHSGSDIHRGRGNANNLMGRVLCALTKELEPRLLELTGGQADNAIANRCQAIFLLPEDQLAQAGEIIESYERVFKEEFARTEPTLSVTLETGSTTMDYGLTLAATGRVAHALVLLPNGIATMSQDIPGLVQTSLNLGILRLADAEVTAAFSVRSSLSTEKAMLLNKLECVAQVLGGSLTTAGDYPGWAYKADSKLRDLAADVFKQQTGTDMVIQAIHAGLECGVFAGKLPGLDCVSLGPNVVDIHSPRERADVASIVRSWDLVREILARAKEL